MSVIFFGTCISVAELGDKSIIAHLVVTNIFCHSKCMASKKSRNSSKNLWVIAVVLIAIVLAALLIAHRPAVSPYATPKPAVSTQSMSFDFGDQKIMLNNQ